MRHFAVVGSGPAGFYTAEALEKAYGDKARIDVRRRAGWSIGNDGDRLFRIFERLRMRTRGPWQHAENGKADPTPTCSHVVLPACGRGKIKARMPRFLPTFFVLRQPVDASQHAQQIPLSAADAVSIMSFDPNILCNREVSHAGNSARQRPA